MSESFSSEESFKKQFIATAMGMFGPGFVWLIHHANARGDAYDPKLTILCTYIAGSPIPEAHPRVQSEDANLINSQTGFSWTGAAGLYSGNTHANIPPGRLSSGTHICLGVCTWEHVWNHDHGVTSAGKRRYLEEWWECIDWKVVEDNIPNKRRF